MRKISDLEGLHATYATVVVGGSVSAVALVSGVAYVEGKAVAIEGQTSNKETIVGYGNAGDPLFGIIDTYEDDGYMTVQDGGYRTAPGVSASLPSTGNLICVNGAGAVSVTASQDFPAKAPRAVSVDNTADVNTVQVFIG